MTRLTEPGTVQAQPLWPRLQRVAEEFRNDASYFYDGAERPDGDHIIFQWTIAGCGWVRWHGKDYDVPPEHAFLAQSGDPHFAYGLRGGAGARPENNSDIWHLLYATFLGPLAFQLVAEWQAVHGPIIALAASSPLIRDLQRLQTHEEVMLSPGFSFGWLSRCWGV